METEDDIVTVNNKNDFFPKARLLLVDHVISFMSSGDKLK